MSKIFRLSRPAPGVYLCQICFEYRHKHELAVDTLGDTWDVCKGQCARDAGIEEAKDNTDGR